MSTPSETLDLPQLPPTWRWSTMGLACLKVQDGTHFSPKNQHAQGKYRYITAKNVKPSGLDLSDLSYLSEADHRAIYKRCDPQKGDVLLVKDGVNTGDAALNTLNEEFSLLSSVCLLRPRSELISGQFLRYFLLSPTGYRLLTGQMTGTAIKRIVLRRIKDSPVPIAPMSEQLRIVAEIEKQFSRLDEAVASLKRTKANLKRYKAAVLKAAVEGKLTEAWRKQHPNVEPASKLLERILAERREKWKGKGKYKEPLGSDIAGLPALPKTWSWSTVASVCSEIVDCPHSTPKWEAEGRICLRTTEFRPGRLDLSDVRYVSQATYEARIQRLKPREKDVVYSREGGILGVACMIPPALNPCLGQRMMLLRSHSLTTPNLLMHWLNSPDLLARVRSLTGGSASPHLNVGDVKDFPVPVAPAAEQEMIVSEVERRMSVIEELEATVEANLTRANRLRQTILSQAFSGRLNS